MCRPTQLVMLLSVVALAAISTRADAGFLLTTGVDVVDPPPSSVRSGARENNDAITAFVERRNLTLANAVVVNFTATGTYDSSSDLPSPSPTIAAGTRVDTYFLHADGVGTSIVRFDATVTFSTDILGVILTQRNGYLTNTDGSLGAPATAYATADDRGLELGAMTNLDNDWVILSPDRRTLTVHLAVGPVVDQLRIITTESFDQPPVAVPEPGTMSLAMFGIFGVAGARWSRRRP